MNRRLLPLTFLALLFAATAARADLIIVQKVERGHQTSDMTMTLKDSKARTDISSEMSMITDRDTGDMITLMHDKKSFMRMPGAATKALIEQVRKLNPGGDTPPKLVATGRTERIGGYETAEYTASVGPIKMSYWIAKGYPGYVAILAQMMKFQQGSLSAVTQGMAPSPADFPGMPIRTEMQTMGQKTTMTLVSVTQRPVDPSSFDIPAGYTELPMPSFNSALPAPEAAPSAPAPPAPDVPTGPQP